MNLELQEYPDGSLDALLKKIFEFENEEKIFQQFEKYLFLNGYDTNLMVIFEIEIGISRKAFFNWLFNQNYDLNKWLPFIYKQLGIVGFPEIREFLGGLIKSSNIDSYHRSRVALLQLEYGDKKDWQYLISHPLPSDFSSEPKLNTKSRKIRVAYLSEKFATHVPSSQTVFQDIIFAGATNDFEIYLFALKHHPDEYTEIYRKRADQYIDLSSLSDSESQDIIQKAQIDIVVDFAGTTPEKYWKLFEHSLRVGIWRSYSFLKNYYHYIIGTKETFPNWQKNYTSVYNNHNCDFFWPTPDSVEINTKLPSVTNQYITFGCFSRLCKMVPNNFDTWAKLLDEVPNSRIAFSFILINSRLYSYIIKEFKCRGIHFSRLVFLKRTSPHEHLLKYNTIDIIIDTFPVNSGFSGGDALWMGVPIVGLSRESDFVTNMLFTLKKIGKENWLTKNEREYIDLCKELAFDEAYRKSLKLTLRQDVINSDLQNGKKYSQELYRCLKGLATKI